MDIAREQVVRVDEEIRCRGSSQQLPDFWQRLPRDQCHLDMDMRDVVALVPTLNTYILRTKTSRVPLPLRKRLIINVLRSPPFAHPCAAGTFPYPPGMTDARF